jgi:hypothetical protein
MTINICMDCGQILMYAHCSLYSLIGPHDNSDVIRMHNDIEVIESLTSCCPSLSFSGDHSSSQNLCAISQLSRIDIYS